MSTSSAPAIGVLPFKGPLARSAKNLQSYVRRKSVSRSARKSAGFKPSGIQQLKAVLEEQAENAPQEAHPRNTERERALQDVLVELLQTEAKYLADLSMVVSAFVQPLQAMLPAQTHYDIFANLQQLEGLHRNLEKDLEPARAAVAASTDGVVATSGGATLADLVARAFQPLLPFFKMYATYCGKYTEAPTKLSEARRKAKVDVFIIAKVRLP